MLLLLLFDFPDSLRCNFSAVLRIKEETFELEMVNVTFDVALVLMALLSLLLLLFNVFERAEDGEDEVTEGVVREPIEVLSFSEVANGKEDVD